MRKLLTGREHELMVRQCNHILEDAGIKAVLVSDSSPSFLYVDRTDMVNVFTTAVSIPEAPGGAYESCRKYVEELIGASILWNKLDDTYFVISNFVKEV